MSKSKDKNPSHDDETEDETSDAAEAKPAVTERRKRKDAHHDEDHHHKEPEPDAPEDQEPGWWMPHAVLGILVVIGMLGFFGVFNKTFAFMRATPPPDAETATTETHKEGAKTAETKPTMPPPQPQRPAQPPQVAPQQEREMFGAKHLLVMYKGSLRAPPTIERTQEEAKKRAEEALAKAKKLGKDKFADVVKDYSDEPGAAQRGGDLGQFPKGAMVPEFQAALEKLKVDEISGIVETKFGYHVILRTK